ncbi:hypothetical protein [Agarilytica rhodophyticola]|uniref:hypothetical protein n=1 Tax=Agarilytica rhodophyticola TaxID=1737490 RepID=UPI001C1FC232|nr:hypothetical protein [Agarilytica rhodophyticola]
MKKYDVVATTGTYQKDGQTKYINKNVGSIIETRGGLRLKLDSYINLAALKRDDDGGVWLSLFEPKDNSQQQQQQQAPQGYQSQQQANNNYQQQPQQQGYQQGGYQNNNPPSF